MNRGLTTRLVSNNPCHDPAVELPPGADVMHGCWLPSPLRGATVAVRPLRPMGYFRAAIKDLARLLRPTGQSDVFVIAGANMGTLLDYNDRLDAEWMEARALDRLGLRSSKTDDFDGPVFDHTFGAISSAGVQWDGRWSPQKSAAPPLPGVAEEILATGARWVRYPVQWAAVERSRGVYDWSAADAWLLGMRRAEQVGSGRPEFRLLLSLITSGAGTVPGKQRRIANPLYDGGDSPHSPAAVVAYARFVASAVSHFRRRHNDTVCVELDNEPDGNWQHHGQQNVTSGQNDGAEYGRMATVAARTIRQAYPDACIVGGALTSWRCSPARHTGDQNCAFLQGILRTSPELLGLIDAFSFHPYATRTAELNGTYSMWRRLLHVSASQSNVTAPPIICGEMGYRLNDPGGITDADQARAVSDLLVTNTLNMVPLTMLYEFPDRIPPVPRLPQEATCYMGLVYMPYRNTSSAGRTSSATGSSSMLAETLARNAPLQWPLQPKPSFYSVHTFASVLRGVRWTGFEGGPYKALQPPRTTYSVAVFANTTLSEPYATVFSSHGTPSMGVDGAELWIIRVPEPLATRELVLPEPCHSPTLECCCQLVSHVGARSIVRSVDGRLELPWQPNATLVYLRGVRCPTKTDDSNCTLALHAPNCSAS